MNLIVGHLASFWCNLKIALWTQHLIQFRKAYTFGECHSKSSILYLRYMRYTKAYCFISGQSPPINWTNILCMVVVHCMLSRLQFSRNEIIARTTSTSIHSLSKSKGFVSKCTYEAFALECHKLKYSSLICLLYSDWCWPWNSNSTPINIHSVQLNAFAWSFEIFSLNSIQHQYSDRKRTRGIKSFIFDLSVFDVIRRLLLIDRLLKLKQSALCNAIWDNVPVMNGKLA